MPKKTTDEQIEELAIIVGRRFDELHQDMTSRFDAMDQRLDRIEYQLSGQERRITILEDRVLQLSRKTGLTFN